MRLSAPARELIGDPDNELVFSAASVWEVAIKNALERRDFRADPKILRHGLLANGYQELAVTGDHALAHALLPPLHEDPFDRMLVAQSIVEGIILVTADPIVARYPAPLRRV